MRQGAIAAGIVILAALGLIIGGCGDDDGDTNGGGDDTALTRAQFLKEGNAICKESEKQREASFEEASSAEEPLNDARKEELVQEAFIEPYGEMLESLKELSPPQGDEQKVEAILQAMETGLQKLEEDPEKGLSSIAMFNKANQLSSEYGLTNCVV